MTSEPKTTAVKEQIRQENARLAQKLASTVSIQQCKRLHVEVTRLKSIGPHSESKVKFIVDTNPFNDDDYNNNSSLKLTGRILPNSDIYNQSSFRIEIKTPQFPMRPPEVRIITPIYHPNVDTTGQICVEILRRSERWTPAVTLVDVIESVTAVIDNPNFDSPLRPWVATQYLCNRTEFNQIALAMVMANKLSRT
ncbi:unnamed protein product [Adineta steineri]|uniref:UBC core domain-containing protein n=1 Tax=Adineta steineri TaxID=433720 RepID=A0A819VT09_9BILA|nr:unnamed protein product [Adineta steineri]CAF4114556.1 unnamed protein product [Adineta steineri]